ncbi:MAG: ATP-grasp domain-containing protein [Gemmataceae bacterium]
MSQSRNLLIMGASVRAAVGSALRAGLQPMAADLFADIDLQARCPARRLALRRYPRGFRTLARRLPPSPWMYTGAMENRPRLVERISQQRPLWGNDGATLRRVRCPLAVMQALQQAGLPFLRVTFDPHAVPTDGRWLIKPLASGGGVHIHFWTDALSLSDPLQRYYFQEYLEGESCAGIFIGQPEGAVLLGVTRQLIGQAWLHASPFRYCGSIGPRRLDETERSIWERLGQVLVERFGLRGVFGVDAVVRDGVPWLVEVNPRYTSSVEVLEWATGVAALGWCEKVFDNSPLVSLGREMKDEESPVLAKTILFSRRQLSFPAAGPWLATLEQLPDIWQVPMFADIPHAGALIEANRPILTFFTRGEFLENDQKSLQEAAQALDHVLGNE